MSNIRPLNPSGAQRADIGTGRSRAAYASFRRFEELIQLLATFAKRYPVGAVSALVLVVIGLLAALASVVSPHDPLFLNFADLKEAPSSQYLLGTDYEGRDVLSRLIHGGRVSLQVSVISVLLGTTGGAVWGIASAYLGGWFDLFSQRLVEIIMSIPTIILAMALLLALGGGLWTVTIVIAITRVPFSTRVIRSVVLSVKELTYVDAARAIGASDLRIMLFHIAPQCVPHFLVLATAYLGTAIAIEASLGFLGIGIAPPTPSWGNMLGGVVAAVYKPIWWVVVFPGIAISITILAFNLLGDALRDALDPKLRGR